MRVKQAMVLSMARHWERLFPRSELYILKWPAFDGSTLESRRYLFQSVDENGATQNNRRYSSERMNNPTPIRNNESFYEWNRIYIVLKCLFPTMK